MPVISFMNMKGGTGKTLLSLLLAVTLAQWGRRVAIVDLDPMQLLGQWGKLPTCPSNVLIFGGVDADSAVEHIHGLSRQFDYVIVDCETRLEYQMEKVGRHSNLAIIPVEDVATELAGAEAAVALLRNLRRIEGDEIDLVLVLNRARVREGASDAAERDLGRLSGLLLETEIEHKEAYSLLLTHGGLLCELERYGVKRLKKANSIASAFATEVVARLERQKESRKVKHFVSEHSRGPRFRTGRSMQLNIRVTPSVEKNFRALAEKQGWSQAETLERAIMLLLAAKRQQNGS